MAMACNTNQDIIATNSEDQRKQHKYTHDIKENKCEQNIGELFKSKSIVNYHNFALSGMLGHTTCKSNLFT